MKINNLNENSNRFQLLGAIFAKFPDLSSEDEDYLNQLSSDELISEIKNRGWEDILQESLNEYWDKIEDTPYYKVASKSVMDSDGFWTEYTMYYNEDEENYFFIFGDSDLYGPDPDYADWECDTNDEAVEWYNNYNGFEDEEDMDESCDTSEPVEECFDNKFPLSLEEDLFDIPDAIPEPQMVDVVIESEPSKETPDPGPEFGVSSLLNNLIVANWNLNDSYNDLISNSESNNMPEIAELAKDIAADINKHIGKLQAALGTLSPNVANVAAGEEEATQQLEQHSEEITEDISPEEKASLEKRGTISQKTRNKLNKIVSKYNGYHEPAEIRNMWEELMNENVEVEMISGYGQQAADGGRSWTVGWSLEGIPVMNSMFVYAVYEPQDSTRNEYTIYFS